jgi:methyl coenzyme M reductase alpha subunit
MVRISTTKTISTINDIVERIIDSGQISRQEHLQLASAILSDYKITDEERRQINRIFDYIQIGRLKLLD